MTAKNSAPDFSIDNYSHCLRSCVAADSGNRPPRAGVRLRFMDEETISEFNDMGKMLLKIDGEVLVAVDHYQQRTMASVIVDRIDWLHPPPHE